MGNSLCGDQEIKEKGVYENNIVKQIQYKGVQICLIQGDVFEENSDYIINCFNDPFDQQYLKELLKKMPVEIREKVLDLKPFEYLLEEIQHNNNKCYYYHYKVPSYQNKSQLLQYYNAYEQGIQKGLEKNRRLISIVESFHRSNQIPNQHFSEIVIRAILNNVKTGTELKMIKLVSMNHLKIRFLKYEIDKIVENTLNEEFQEYRNQQFFRFINPSDSIIKRQKEEEQENRNDFSLSQIKLQDVQNNDNY